jgi:hypothetical protein
VVANPRVTVEVGAETYGTLAIPTDCDERERLWAMVKGAYPFFADHEAATARSSRSCCRHSRLRRISPSPDRPIAVYPVDVARIEGSQPQWTGIDRRLRGHCPIMPVNRYEQRVFFVHSFGWRHC